MGDRQFEPRVYVALKAVFSTFIEECFGYEKVAAGRTRVEQQTISAYMSKDAPKKFAPIDVLLDLCKASKDVSVFAFIADLLGYRLIPKRAPSGEASTVAAAFQSVRESAEATSSVLRAIEDRRVTEAERADVRAHLRAQIVAAETLDQLLSEPGDIDG